MRPETLGLAFVWSMMVLLALSNGSGQAQTEEEWLEALRQQGVSVPNGAVEPAEVPEEGEESPPPAENFPPPEAEGPPPAEGQPFDPTAVQAFMQAAAASQAQAAPPPAPSPPAAAPPPRSSQPSQAETPPPSSSRPAASAREPEDQLAWELLLDLARESEGGKSASTSARPATPPVASPGKPATPAGAEQPATQASPVVSARGKLSGAALLLQTARGGQGGAGGASLGTSLAGMSRSPWFWLVLSLGVVGSGVAVGVWRWRQAGSAGATAGWPVVGTLEVVMGPHAGRRWTFAQEHVVIGQEETCDVVLADARVASRHAELSGSADGPLLVNVNPEARVRVNGQVVDQVLLKPGDLIELGRTTLAFRPSSA